MDGSQFARTIGIDYSGAQTPTASLKGLRVYVRLRAEDNGINLGRHLNTAGMT
jgi:hypothetical protein